MINRELEQSHNNPVYSAGFIAGKQFAEEQLMEQQQNKPRPSAMTVNLQVSQMDVFKELAGITVELGEYVRDNHPTEEGKALLHKIDLFHERLEQQAENGQRKRESEGITVTRL